MKPALNLTLALALLTAACSPIYVEYSYPEGVDFSRYRTYAWLPLPKSEGVVTPPTGESQLQKRIRVAIERELDAKGLEKVSEGGDLGVRYQIGADFSTDVQYSYGLGYPDVRVDEIKTGELIVQLLDRRGVVMWEGVAENTARVDASIEQRNQTIDKSIEKLFRKYPPY